MKWFKRLCCDHKWFESSRYVDGSWVSETIRKNNTYVNVYCPKCGGRDLLSYFEWERISGENHIKEEYERNERN